MKKVLKLMANGSYIFISACTIGKIDDECRNFLNTYNPKSLYKNSKDEKMNRNPLVKFNEIGMNRFKTGTKFKPVGFFKVDFSLHYTYSVFYDGPILP